MTDFPGKGIVAAIKTTPKTVLEDIEHVMRLADFESAQQHKAHLRTDKGGIASDVRTHRDSPERKLIPGKQIAGEAGPQSHQQEKNAHHPVELAGWLVGAGVEDAQHMQDGHQHHRVRRPTMHIAHQLSVEDFGLQDDDAVVGHFGRGHIVKHDEYAG